VGVLESFHEESGGAIFLDDEDYEFNAKGLNTGKWIVEILND
jgi:hypothetical protein